MTLNFYLISTVISLIIDIIMVKVSCHNNVVERNGYAFTQKGENKLRKLLLFPLDKLYCFIPIVNITFSIGLVIGYLSEKSWYFSFRRSTCYETFIWSKLLAWEKQGKIYDVKEKELWTNLYNHFVENAAKKQQDGQTTSQSEKETLEHKESTVDKKTYDEMSNEEKLAVLQEEREKILNDINSTSSSPSVEEETPTSNNSINKTYTLKK
jgi:hypothetical protein